MDKEKKSFLLSNALVSTCLVFLASLLLGFYQADLVVNTAASKQKLIIAIIIYIVAVVTFLVDVLVATSSKRKIAYIIDLAISAGVACAAGAFCIVTCMAFEDISYIYLVAPIVCIAISVLALIGGIVLSMKNNNLIVNKVFKAIVAIILVIAFTAVTYFSVTSITSNYETQMNNRSTMSIISSIFK